MKRKKSGSKLLKAMSCSSKRGGTRSDSHKTIEEILKSGLGTIMEEEQEQQACWDEAKPSKKKHRIRGRFLSLRDMYVHFLSGFSSSRTNFISLTGVTIM